MKELPNEKRNNEVSEAIKKLDGLDLGAQTSKHIGIAQSLSLLNVAESLQLLQLQMIETSKENRVAMENQVGRLITSNEETDKINKSAIRWNKGLTVALIFVTLVIGLLQAYVMWMTSQKERTVVNIPQTISNLK